MGTERLETLEQSERQQKLNMDVTSAILAAEREPTIERWQRVLELESALSTEAATELERDIAAGGVVTARERIAELMGDGAGSVTSFGDGGAGQ